MIRVKFLSPIFIKEVLPSDVALKISSSIQTNETHTGFRKLSQNFPKVEFGISLQKPRSNLADVSCRLSESYGLMNLGNFNTVVNVDFHVTIVKHIVFLGAEGLSQLIGFL